MNYGGKDVRGRASIDGDFVADFERADFHGERKLVQRSSFEELQKVSLDLEKRLHERIIRSAAEAKSEEPYSRVDADVPLSRHAR